MNIPGSRFGLSLLLNAEQYEYMSGPQNDVGIKVNNSKNNNRNKTNIIIEIKQI